MMGDIEAEDDDLQTFADSRWAGTPNQNSYTDLSEPGEQAISTATGLKPRLEPGRKRARIIAEDKSKIPIKKRKLEKIGQSLSVCTVTNCRYSTPHRKDLARHMRKHTGEKPFACDQCPKSFSRYDKLVCHKRAHDGLRPNKCNLCDYAALDAGSLRKHVRVHSDERPYKCQMCPYKARDSSQLVVHLRHHTGDSPYTCTYKQCQAAFKTPSDLQRHARHHTGEKPYACQLCDYRAAVKCNLNAHMKKYHTDGIKTSEVHKNLSTASENVDADLPALDTIPGSEMVAGPSASAVQAPIQKKQNRKIKPSPETEPLAFRFACKLCHYKGETIKLFRAHMKRKHQAKEPVVVKETIMQPPKKRNLKEYSKFFECSRCPAKFVREDSLRVHMKQHVPLGPPPMPVLPSLVRQTEPIAAHSAQGLTPHLTQQVQTENVVEGTGRPQVIAFAVRKCTES